MTFLYLRAISWLLCLVRIQYAQALYRIISDPSYRNFFSESEKDKTFKFCVWVLPLATRPPCSPLMLTRCSDNFVCLFSCCQVMEYLMMNTLMRDQERHTAHLSRNNSTNINRMDRRETVRLSFLYSVYCIGPTLPTFIESSHPIHNLT